MTIVVAARESRYLIESVAIACALPLVIAYRLHAGPVSPGETLAWLGLAWGVGSALRTWARRLV